MAGGRPPRLPGSCIIFVVGGDSLSRSLSPSLSLATRHDAFSPRLIAAAALSALSSLSRTLATVEVEASMVDGRRPIAGHRRSVGGGGGGSSVSCRLPALVVVGTRRRSPPAAGLSPSMVLVEGSVETRDAMVDGSGRRQRRYVPRRPVAAA